MQVAAIEVRECQHFHEADRFRPRDHLDGELLGDLVVPQVGIGAHHQLHQADLVGGVSQLLGILQRRHCLQDQIRQALQPVGQVGVDQRELQPQVRIG